MENWKPVYGYEGLYEISDLGNVRRVECKCKLSSSDLEIAHTLRRSGYTYTQIALRFKVSKTAMRKAMIYQHKRTPLKIPNRLIKPQISGGYLSVGLSKNGIVEPKRVHTLVMRAFVGERPAGWHINHKNGARTDARLSNLEYCTASYNAQHSYRVLGRKNNRKYGEENHLSKMTAEQVRSIRKSREQGARIIDLAKQYGMHRDGIYRIVSEKNWRHIL